MRLKEADKILDDAIDKKPHKKDIPSVDG